jgi:A/G-specific adenine glycosylase
MRGGDRLAPPYRTNVRRADQLLPLQSAVLEWYAANRRDLAFRRTRDPWAVLVSEVIAQQTQAVRAAEAWQRFIEAFPTPTALAAVSPATVIRAWRGLGYNRRAIALREAAIRIVEDHDGRVPDTLEALTALPGVGPYTARAILAFAFDRPVAPIDTNIRRVLDRAMGPLPTAPKALQSTADGFVPEAGPATWSHALMDLGATICVARAPRCDACPIRTLCRSTRTGTSMTLDRAQSQGAGSRTTPFPNTIRWRRGRILDRLRDAPDDAWVAFGDIGAHPHGAVTIEVRRMAAEGLLESSPTGELARLVSSSYLVKPPG